MGKVVWFTGEKDYWHTAEAGSVFIEIQFNSLPKKHYTATGRLGQCLVWRQSFTSLEDAKEVSVREVVSLFKKASRALLHFFGEAPTKD